MELCHRNSDILERVLKQIALSNSTVGEVRTLGIYKTTRTLENFNSRGTKIILLSDKLGLMLTRKAIGFKSVSLFIKSITPPSLMFSWEIYEYFRSSHRRFFMEKAVLKNFAIFTGKLQACNFIKNRIQ